MDNFDHEENTVSGIGGSHDAILVLFQKPDFVEIQEEISKKPEYINQQVVDRQMESKLHS